MATNQTADTLIDLIAPEKKAASPTQNVKKGMSRLGSAINKSAKKKKAETAKTQDAPIIPTESFAYRPEDMERIRTERIAALQGFSGGEIAKRREGFQQPIETNRLAAQRGLERQQGQSGVKGGIAYAQSRDVNKIASQASANAGRDLFLANEDEKRRALDALQGFSGKERFGQMSSTLAGKQLGIQERSAEDQNAMNQQILQYLQSRDAEQLPDSGIGGGQGPTGIEGGYLGQQYNHAKRVAAGPLSRQTREVQLARGGAAVSNPLHMAYEWSQNK